MHVTRTEWHDWFVDAGESAVFVNDKVAVLSELATTLVELVGEGADLQALSEGLTAAFGVPEGQPRELTRERVAELVTNGVLATDEVGGLRG